MIESNIKGCRLQSTLAGSFQEFAPCQLFQDAHHHAESMSLELGDGTSKFKDFGLTLFNSHIIRLIFYDSRLSADLLRNCLFNTL